MATEKEKTIEEQEEKKGVEQTAPDAEATSDNSEQSENHEEVSKLDQVKAEKEAIQDKYVRLYSEFENFRRRTAKEKIEIINNASEKILADLLPVLDDFERAMESNKDNNDIDSIKQGVELVHNKLFGVLSANGLKPMESKGKEFDIDEHEAITKIPAPSKKEKGKVVDVVEKGYYLNEKVLRFAKVVIGE